MQRFYVVVNHDNHGMFLAPAHCPVVWTTDLFCAHRFDDEDSALGVIVRDFGGKGIASECQLAMMQ